VGEPTAEGTAIDLLNCDREPIHVPGHIQPNGFLLALTPDWHVSHVSSNIADFTGIAAADWLAQGPDAFITPDAIHALRNQIATVHGPDAVQRCFALSLIAGRPPFDVAVHLAGDTIVIEAEPAVIDDREAAALVRAMVARLKHSSGLSDFFRDGARHVQALTGFDRVMVYRFDDDGHGEVVAEALRGYRDSYLGLHYPASDIPAQARALYLRSPFRIIADVAAPPVPIETAADVGGERLDQSLSVLRAVSPIHIEYLKNMEVAASLSISIVVNGALWGLFACHHPSARLPSFAYRTAAELFGEMFSMMLEGRLRRDAAEHELRDGTLVTLLVAEMAHDDDLFANPGRLGELIFDTIPADGLSILIDGSIRSSGQTPDEVQCAAIVAMLADRDTHGVFATDALATLLPEVNSADAAGFIAIPLMRRPGDYLLLFRCERVRTVRWAGDPDKSAAAGRLTPRLSFAAWTQLVHGRCLPFTIAERHAAEAIRVALMEALLRSTDGARPDPGLRSGQDMLIAELNHRVRNILALIRGLISQTRGSAETAEGFIATLDARVQSLARAHDQITSDRWGPARLKDLIETESGAYLGGQSGCVQASGPNIMVHPQAFTTLALVFHELMTNAAKYGALSASGTVVVQWRLEDDGDLAINWSEQGGPPVSPPSRRGFGSTIIERSIPYDLGGSSLFEYLPGGFEAFFRVPAKHLAGISTVEAVVQPSAILPLDLRLLAGLDVLLVEDSMIIALDCAETLKSLGAATVTTAASLAEALAAIRGQDFQFALLDFNLGTETSSDVADILTERGVPFAFATGYDGDLQNKGHANAPVIGKPYGRKQLIPLLLKLGFDPDARALDGGS
jgi:light-regulated signal transduction histidine kinase (bacteriophytochrome)/CheY-like chemotaxis protein